MLLGKSSNTNNQDSVSFSESYIKDVEMCGQLISRYMYEEAWMLMNTLQQESIPHLINKAICLYEINRYAESIQACERAMELLSTCKNKVPLGKPEEIQLLHEVQKNQVTYLNPVTFRYVELFPENLKESLLRVIVDCWSALGNTAKVIKTGTPLLNKGYRNVMEAFYKIDHLDTNTPVSAGYQMGEDGKVYFYIDGEKQ